MTQLKQEAPEQESLFDLGDEPAPAAAPEIYPDGQYRWVSELPMMRSFFLLLEVWRAFGIAYVITAVLLSVLLLLMGDGLSAVFGTLMGVTVAMGIILLLSLPAYWIISRANNGTYTVLFEMDEEGISHTQIKTEKAKALEILTMYVGSAAHKPGVIGAGMLSSAGGSLYSKFVNVKTVKGDSEKNLIRLNGILTHNQVYTEPEDYDFVYRYIAERCVNAELWYDGKPDRIVQ